MFKGFGKWLLTERGRNACFAVATVTTLGTACAKIVPNTFLLDQYKDIIRLYNNGLSVPLPEELKLRFNKAIEYADIREDQRKLFHPFTVFGFDMRHAGTSFSRFGAIIGIPINFTYKDVEKIEKSQIKVKSESVPWGTPEATQLLDSMILSEKAQLYAIAQEIKTAESPKLILDTSYLVFSLMGCYSISNFINTKLNLYDRPRSMRFTLYILVATFIYANYCFLKDFTQMHYERQVDEFLINRDPSLSEGGKEYYEKMLQRNIALRKLLGKEGESRYSPMGNENFLLRQKRTPLVHRKEFFETTLPS